MQLSKDRLGRFTASEAWKLWPKKTITDKQLKLIDILEAKEKRTDKQEAEFQLLIEKRDNPGDNSTRNTYTQEKAEELVTGHKKEFSNKHTDHGHQYELEAIEMFAKVSGLVVEGLEQRFFPIGENAGATPDAAVKDFSDLILATVDCKCPTTTFFDQKLEFIAESKPEYQNCPKEYFIQGQVQMLAATIDNKSKGLPPVKKHYLVRYLAPIETDRYGNEISYEHLPLESRIFWAVIEADKKWQDEFLLHVDSASAERDLLVKLMKHPIIPVHETSP